MGLDLLNDLVNKVKESDFVENFIEELSDYLGEKNNMELEDKCNLYQVVDFSSKGVYLRDVNTNKIFEETNLPQELKEKIGNDYVLSYKNGKYEYEEELTDKFMNSLVDISTYQGIKNKFEKETNILEIGENTIFKLQNKDENYSILNYGKNNNIKVPNELIPFFSREGANLIYKNGKFVIK